MRYFLCFVVLCAAGKADAQDIQIRLATSPPPTTFVQLKAQPGRKIAGPCVLPIVSIALDSLVPIALADSATLRVPPDWQARPRLEYDIEVGSTVLGGPADSRVRIERVRNGALGRSFLRYRDDSDAIGPTCEVDRGDVGVIWTFYEPDPGDQNLGRRFGALGEIMAPGGRWYKVSLWASGRAERAHAASSFTEVVLRQPK